LFIFNKNNSELPGVSRHEKFRAGTERGKASTAGCLIAETKFIRKIIPSGCQLRYLYLHPLPCPTTTASSLVGSHSELFFEGILFSAIGRPPVLAW
jgi:hypothetical protein